MKFREWVNNNSALATIIAVLVLISALVYMVSSSTGSKSKTPTHRWYYDVDAGKLFTDTVDNIGPFEAPSGGEAVEAIIYGCGDCDDLKIAWLIKYTEEMKEEMIQFNQKIKDLESGNGEIIFSPLALIPPAMMGSEGKLYSKEKPIDWVEATSSDAMSFMQGAYHCPPGVKVHSACFPK